MRSAVKDILPCDVLADEILSIETDPFDCITTSLCLEGACTDLQSYTASLCKITTLLKQGGYFVCVILLGDEWYAAGSSTFSCLSLSIEEVKEAYHEAGLEITQTEVYMFTEEELAQFKDAGYCKGIAFITAKKE